MKSPWIANSRQLSVAYWLAFGFCLLAIAYIMTPDYTNASDIKGPVSPSRNDKCPVCGMFIYKYPDWTAQILFRDGGYAVFDGVKDMMKYYFNIKQYSSRNTSDIKAMYVKDYYSLTYVDARKAFYVIGSDIRGPMGKELVPFEKESDAKVFMKDHKGHRLLTFQEINTEIFRLLE